MDNNNIVLKVILPLFIAMILGSWAFLWGSLANVNARLDVLITKTSERGERIAGVEGQIKLMQYRLDTIDAAIRDLGDDTEKKKR